MKIEVLFLTILLTFSMLCACGSANTPNAGSVNTEVLNTENTGNFSEVIIMEEPGNFSEVIIIEDTDNQTLIVEMP